MTLEPLYHAVAFLVVHIHGGLAPIFGSDSGWSWALAIVLLTIAMRLILFPVFVKQIRNQRAMQALQPKMKELQTRYKNDKEKLNQEMMALWKEAGANPLSGCLPLLLQIPIFISLFHVLNNIKPKTGCTNPNDPKLYSVCYKTLSGFPQHDIASASQSKIFGVPIAAAFNSSHKVLVLLSASATSTKILCAILTVAMVATTFITQRQLMARNGPAADSQMAQTQKILLYVFPLFFLVYGYRFPIGVLLYWLTTNVWSMGQQFFVIRRMDAPVPVAAGQSSGPLPGAKPAAKPAAAKPRPADKPKPTGSNAAASPPLPADGPAAPPARQSRPNANRRPNQNRNRNRKRKRGR